VGIVGLGYVGLPVAVIASRKGFPVIGVDSDRGKVLSLVAGNSHIVDVSNEDLSSLESCSFTSDPLALREADVILLTVPTPLTDGAPDLSPIREACADVARALRSGQLVVLESTTYPGTTEEVVLPILETSGLEGGKDFFLAYSPERIDPGNARSYEGVPKVVSGIGPTATDLARLFYSQLVQTIVVTPTPRDAEMAKLIENTFRQVNIALANELAMLAPQLGVDIWAAIEAAATKGFGFMPFWPGPGVGGHCIPIDPSYLAWRVRHRLGLSIDFIEHAVDVNNKMPGFIVQRIGDALNERGKPLRGSRVLVIGVAYKTDVNDVRGSPAIEVLERLAGAGAVCSYHDPYVSTVCLLGSEIPSEPLNRDMLSAQDCVAILTAHSAIDYDVIVASAQMVFDARGVTRRIPNAANVIRL